MTAAAAPGGRRSAGREALLTAENVMLELLAVLLGNGRSDKGLLTRMAQGQQHVATCQSGMWVQQGDSLRGGQPCSDRCTRAYAAIRRAGMWLRANDQPVPIQLTFDRPSAAPATGAAFVERGA